MRDIRLGIRPVFILGTLITAAAGAAVVRAQDTAPASTQAAHVEPADAAARLSGQWTLNKDLSTDTSQFEQPANGQGGAGGRGGSGGGGGGGRGGGGGYGGRRGGGGGGMGGRGGGGGFGGGRGGGGSQEQMLQAREARRELLDAPALVTIVANPTAVNFTDDQGAVRKFAIDDKKESVDLGAAKIDVTSHWDGNSLVQDIVAGTLKVTRKFTPTDEGHQLVINVGPTASNGQTTQPQGAAMPPATFIYDKAK